MDAMPVPVSIEPGMFTVEGNVLNEPKSWASLRGMKGSAAFDQVAPVQSLSELLKASRKAAKRS